MIRCCAKTVFSLIVLLAIAGSAWAAVTAPGTVLYNQAQVRYFDPLSGSVKVLKSNVSQLVVSAARSVQLDGDAERYVAAGQQISIGHLLTNTGNLADRYALTLTNLGGDQGDLLALNLYHDLNGNGIADPGEPALTTTPEIPAGGSLLLVIAGTVPAGQNAGDQLRVHLAAASQNDASVVDEVTDTVHVGNGAFLNLNKVASQACSMPVTPGQTLRYTITYTNTGSVAPLTRTLQVGGQPETGVLIEDILPGNVVLEAGSLTGLSPVQAIALVHLAGTAADQWQRFDQWDGVSPVERFGVLVPAAHMGSNYSGGFSFAVRLNSNISAGTVLLNRARVDVDGDDTAEFTSNQVCNTVQGNSTPAIAFLRPSAAVINGSGVPAHGNDSDFERADIYRLLANDNPDVLRQGVYVQLDAQQLNLSPTAQDVLEVTASGQRLIAVTLSSHLTGDSVRVVMRETDANSGRFRSVYPVVLSAQSSGNNGLCPAGATLASQPSWHAGTTTTDALNQGCVLRSAGQDRLTARFAVPMRDGGGGTSLQVVTAAAAVDPAGMVFDASDGRPLPGASVMLYQSRQPLASSGAASCSALTAADYVLATHPFTGDTLPVEQTGTSHPDNSSVEGEYRYPYASPGYCYYLDVTPPTGYYFPSRVAPASVQMFYPNISESSYGLAGYDPLAPRSGATNNRGAFLLGAENVYVDIPLDPATGGNGGVLVLDKQVDLATAAIGDVLAYSVTLTSNHNTDLFAARIIDTLPYGFRYVPDSAWLEVNNQRVRIAEPTGGGAQKTFALQRLNADGSLSALPLAPGSSVTLHYGLRLSAGAADSNGINRAVAEASTLSGFVYRSNEDQVRVEIRSEGVLSDKAMVFGKIYVDSNCDNLQSDGEWPIGGVKLYMQDGTWVITDENGQYSIYGLNPGLHTLKIDPLTLPEGVRLKPIDNRHAADPGSRFVDLTPGEYHRADFAAVCPTPGRAQALFEELKARNAAIDGEWMLDEAARFDPMRQQSTRSGYQQAGGDGDLGSGVYTQGVSRGTDATAINDAWQRIGRANAGSVAPTEDSAGLQAAMPVTEAVAAQITHEQAQAGTWLWPLDDISRDGRFQVVVRAGLEPALEVNGERVPDSQLGERVLNRRENAEVLSWYGITLREGKNQVRVVTQDGFGNQRELARGEFVRPGAARLLELLPEAETLAADGGRSALPIRIHLRDANGYPARGVHFVTLEADLGLWQEDDIQPETAGHQVRVQDGEALVHLRSTEYTGPVRLRASLEQLTASARVEQVAPLRPMVATGFVQLRGSVSQINDSGLSPSAQRDGIDDDGLNARAAVFMKGRVRGDAHLTLAYDTDKDLDEEDEVRRDLNPADYYPIPGDASVRGYDARSRSKLYARLEKNRHSIMWGDYLTDAQNEVLDLGRTQRTLTGVNAVYDNGSTRAQLFGARPDLDQVTEELRGNGTALLYRLSNTPARDSETVELLVRDRNNPGLVLTTRALTRYVDYSVNYFTGDIRFHDVVPTLDEDLNPVFVRISYSIEGTRDAYNVYGLRLHQQLTERFGVSLSSTRDEHESDGFDLHSVSAEYRISDRTRVHASTGRMGHENGDPDGNAYAVNAQHAWENGSTTDLRWARAEDHFDNPAAGISEAREELRLEHRQQFSARTALTLEGLRSEQLDGDDEQNSVGLIGEQQFGNTALRLGARGIEQRDSTDTDRFGTWIVGASQNHSLLGRPLQIGADYEQAFRYGDRRRIGADADLQITDKTSLYSRYEMINSLSGVNLFNSDTETRQFTFGARSALTRNTDVFSEYRQRGAIDGRDVAAANGVKSDIELQPGLLFTPSIEWIETLDGNSQQDATAISVGMEDKRNVNRRTLGRVETRFGDGRTYYGLSAANIWRVTTDWSAVVRDDLRLQYTDGQPKEGDNIVTLGAAHRPRRDNRHHMLFMYKWKEHWGGLSGADRTVHMFSTHHNYQAADNWIVSGRMGVKWQRTDLGTVTAYTDAWVMDGRLIWDITRRFDLDLHAGVLGTEGVSELRHSAGIGLNALVRRNLRMGIGYNLVGFRDEDLDPEGYNAHGVYIGLEYKFDENDLGWLGSKAAGQRSYMGASR
jgi:uncharacterized repeat protein (TIGR01451 family)